VSFGAELAQAADTDTDELLDPELFDTARPRATPLTASAAVIPTIPATRTVRCCM
jgi:hypothetical protein